MSGATSPLPLFGSFSQWTEPKSAFFRSVQTPSAPPSRRAVALLGIENLHFHDLRHEGVSRLFEMGLSLPRVAAVSGHRSWTTLKRYTHLRQVGDKWAGWEWLERIAPPAGD